MTGTAWLSDPSVSGDSQGGDRQPGDSAARAARGNQGRLGASRSLVNSDQRPRVPQGARVGEAGAGLRDGATEALANGAGLKMCQLGRAGLFLPGERLPK